MSSYTSDFTEYDRKRREDMVNGSERLLATLCREHPRIVTHLQQRSKQNRSTRA